MFIFLLSHYKSVTGEEHNYYQDVTKCVPCHIKNPTPDPPWIRNTVVQTRWMLSWGG